MENSTQKTSDELQREIDLDRQRIGDRIDAIQERMSPGQLVDEVLAYAKGSGGAEYVSNLGHALKANPIPVALMGISLAWLVAKQAAPNAAVETLGDEVEHPLYPVNGPVRRIGPPRLEGDARYSHFSDSTGKSLKALTDDAGRRAGHFMDEAGKMYRGFSDTSGRQVDHILDETGAMLDAASGWASEKWGQAKNTATELGSKASSAASAISHRTSSAATGIQDQTRRMNEAILTHFRDQPLVGGALAFAVGAAIGAALPRTEVEDDLLGETADATKDALSAQTSEVVERGKQIASDVYESAIEIASDAHDDIKERVIEEADALKPRGESPRAT
ncbi:DUF3618 domain-containing protein [Rhizobium cauense]|uniref:DUF3618 domain-containing protein n=1 Tax=Rhizobium cauense TaxID=1166683 RepID=UPI001C6F248E|nr:DUF3618 domain-containing protein [Rhizobium cauense]MBW9118107.1 DUF3618 domain-containing protein [Rhizobium cauense]